jgi:hypothetical protein
MLGHKLLAAKQGENEQDKKSATGYFHFYLII